LRDAAEKQPVHGLALLSVLGIYCLASGGVLGMRLRAEFSGEDLSAAPARRIASTTVQIKLGARAAERRRTWDLAATESGAPPAMVAIVEKEFRSLWRTLPLLYALGAPLLMVLVVSGGFLRGSMSTHAPVFAFPLCVFFAQLGFHQLWGNSLGTEGAGVQLYFLSPTSFRTVLLAKNIFHAVVFAVVMVIAGVLAALRLGEPSGVMVATTAAWLLFVLPCNLAVGNIFSLTMPYKVNPGRISRQRRSQGAAFLSLLMQAGLVGIGALVYLLCSKVSMPLLAVPIFLAMAAVAGIVWLRILSNADHTANQRKEQLIAALIKADD
jgi:ABC-2 type transport system permease protein